MLGTCLGIFFARVLDVTLGTIRMAYSVKGNRIVSGIIAFFELFVWFLVAKEALNTDINSLWIPVSYAGGYAAGTYLGTFISGFIKSMVCVEVIVKEDNMVLVKNLRENGFGLSIVSLQNDLDSIKKEMFIIETNSKNLKKLKSLIYEFDPNAFMMVNETKIIQNGFIK